MTSFLTTRILQAIPVMLVMSIITFLIIQAPPGEERITARMNTSSCYKVRA